MWLSKHPSLVLKQLNSTRQCYHFVLTDKIQCNSRLTTPGNQRNDPQTIAPERCLCCSIPTECTGWEDQCTHRKTESGSGFCCESAAERHKCNVIIIIVMERSDIFHFFKKIVCTDWTLGKVVLPNAALPTASGQTGYSFSWSCAPQPSRFHTLQFCSSRPDGKGRWDGRKNLRTNSRHDRQSWQLNDFRYAAKGVGYLLNY